jgi:hypothetical protein
MNRPLPRLIALFCLLGATLPLSAQDQTASSTNAGPLQIQEQPASGTMPAPSLFGPYKTNTRPSPVAVDSNAAAAAPVAADSNAPSPNSGMGSPGQNPPPSDPNSLIPPPVEPAQPSPVNAAGNEAKQREEQKTRYYTAKAKADKEEALADLLTKADKAKTDEGKRQTLREYYDLLAKRMKKIDPSISEWIDTMHAAYLRRLAQVRIEPSIPLTPPPTPASDSTPAPEKKKKIKKADDDDDASPAPSPKKSKKKVVDADASASPSPAAAKKSQ